MPSWSDELIHEYSKSKLNQEDPMDAKDLDYINSMIRDMTESIERLETGKDPKIFKGRHVDSIYQKRSYENMDLIPDIEVQLREENDINKKHLFMTREEKVIMADILASFSLRE